MRRYEALLPAIACAAALAAAGTLTVLAQGGAAAGKIGQGTTANPHSPLVSYPNNVAPGFSLSLLAQGSDPLENPCVSATQSIAKFGLLGDNTKTEPDENTYVVFDHNPGGPTAGYDYGLRFLYQGHENGSPFAYITRINLDVTDPAHRITLVPPANPANCQTGFGSIDGSTWNPFTQTLLFTQERSNASFLPADLSKWGGVIQVTPGWPPVVTTLDGILGKAAYEGIHPDDRGNLIIVEDTGGRSVPVDPTKPFNATTNPRAARQPNSFVYKFVPYNASNLSQGGTLYALQVWIDGAPITFHGGTSPTDADANLDIFSMAQLKLHTLDSSWPVTWVKIHDNDLDGFADFNANLAAKVAGATPFKRPENAAFLPGSGFNTFFFDPTGDTSADSGNQAALSARGAWGSIFRVDFPGQNPIGSIEIVVLGDAQHAAFDNIAFSDTQTLLAAEDRGDSLHEQLNLLDSIWAFDVRGNGPAPRRLVGQGRDDVATAVDVSGGEGDNEPTGLHVSDGATSIQHLLGKPLSPDAARWFITQQHGRNQVFEIVR